MSKADSNIRKLRNHLPKWPAFIFMFFLFIFLTADFIANEKPIYCKINGETHFPILKSYGVNLGITNWDPALINADWKSLNYDRVIYPLIPYSPNNLDLVNGDCASPFGPQKVMRKKFWHWLGTDPLGRDTAAGLIHGVRIAFLVGFGAMGIALICGLFFGLLSGYYGDEKFKLSKGRLGAMLFYGLIVLLYGFVFPIQNNLDVGTWLGIFIILALIYFPFHFLSNFFESRGIFMEIISVKWDLMIMRGIEIFKSIPGLFLFLALLALIKNPTILSLILIIGLITWTPIARFLRSEILKLREAEFIQSAKSLGLSDIQIIRNHILPNALGPVLIVLSFGFANTVLLESTLSFLGIGLSEETISWGMILNTARTNFSAWWLAIFPGLAIFLCVYIFNRFGDELLEKRN